MRTILALSFISVVSLASAAPAPGSRAQAADDWKALRCLADKSNDGKLTRAEVDKINIRPVRMLINDFSVMDANKDGVVTLKEYTDYVQKQRANWEGDFTRADTDKSGGLSKAELAGTQPREFVLVKRHFEEMDTNHDGQVTMAERDSFIEKARQHRMARRQAAESMRKARRKDPAGPGATMQ